MISFAKRAAFGWGASAAAPAHPTKGLVVHFDGSNQGLADKPHTTCIAYWKRTRTFHMTDRGWKDIGYSWGICGHGGIFEGRGIDREQAAQPGGNTTYYSVTFMSGPAEEPTAKQLSAFAELRTWLMTKHGAGPAIKGHRDFIATDCPGPRLYALVRSGALAKGEDDMPTAKEIWNHEIAVPWGTPENPEHQADTLLVEANKTGRSLVEMIRRTEAKIDAQGAALMELVATISTMQPGEPIDVDALVHRIEQAIESITVRLDVPDPAAPAA